jgi:transglutaminase-like putative cysteine protease
MKRNQIRHTTRYHYAEPVQLGPHKLMIRPRSGHDLRIETAQLVFSPPSQVGWHRDIYGNSVAVATFQGETRSLSIQSDVVVQHFEAEPLNFRVNEQSVMFPFHFDSAERLELIPYQTSCFPSDGSILRDWLRQFWQPGQVIETYTLLNNINQFIVQNFAYRMREEPGIQRPAETLENRSGSCRDFATLFIEACRHFGLAARFVSGYLNCPTSVQGHGSTHAWAEVYLPGAGWKGFDNTSGILVGHDHIATAVCRHPTDAAPISGTFTCPALVQPTMTVSVEVLEI